MNTTMKKRVAILMSVCTFLVSVPIWAQDDGERRPAGDPFKPLIEKEEPLPSVQPTSMPPQPPEPPKPVTPPVDFSVQAIASDRAQKVAVIEYQGQIYIVQDGTPVPEAGNAAFVVKKVSDSQVSVYDPRVKRLVNKQIIER